MGGTSRDNDRTGRSCGRPVGQCSSRSAGAKRAAAKASRRRASGHNDAAPGSSHTAAAQRSSGQGARGVAAGYNDAAPDSSHTAAAQRSSGRAVGAAPRHHGWIGKGSARSAICKPRAGCRRSKKTARTERSADRSGSHLPPNGSGCHHAAGRRDIRDRWRAMDVKRDRRDQDHQCFAQTCFHILLRFNVVPFANYAIGDYT
jgi:hypothetical protein